MSINQIKDWYIFVVSIPLFRAGKPRYPPSIPIKGSEILKFPQLDEFPFIETPSSDLLKYTDITDVVEKLNSNVLFTKEQAMKFFERFLEEKDNDSFNIKFTFECEEINYEVLYYNQMKEKGEKSFIINITETDISVQLE